MNYEHMSCDEISELAGNEHMVFIGDGEEREKLAGAIIGASSDGAAIYSYTRLVELMMDDYLEDKENPSEADLEQARTNAIEWIDYNTIRSLPYAAKLTEDPEAVAPIIMTTELEMR